MIGHDYGFRLSRWDERKYVQYAAKVETSDKDIVLAKDCILTENLKQIKVRVRKRAVHGDGFREQV